MKTNSASARVAVLGAPVRLVVTLIGERLLIESLIQPRRG
jgi:hypothetical protein